MQLQDILKPVLVRIHPEGYLFITLFALATLFLSLFSEIFWIPGIVLTLWCTYFFRDPDRTTPIRKGLVISPADGVVQMIHCGPTWPLRSLRQSIWVRRLAIH